MYFDVPVTAGAVYSVAVNRVLVSGVATQRLSLQVEWRDSGAALSTTTVATGQVTTGVADTTVFKSGGAGVTAPAGAVTARVTLISVAGTGYLNWAISSYLETDGLMFNTGATLRAYFDGDSSGAAWSGTAHASTSVFTFIAAPGAPTLTQGSTPSPNVEIYFPTLDTDAQTITVWRTADGVTEAVRGALAATVAGDFVVRDYEVPFGVVSTYTATLSGVAGTAAATPTTIQVNITDVWFQSQVEPDVAFVADLTDVSFSDITTGRRTEKVYVLGKNRPFMQDFGQTGIEGMSAEVWTDTTGEADMMKALLNVSPWLIRTPPVEYTLPRLLSVTVDAPQRLPQGVNRTAVRWVLIVDEIEPISKGIVKPLVTWDDWTATFPAASYTWTNVIAAYGAGTWTDAVRTGP